MGEYLTTGQIIDKLPVGRIAETVGRTKEEYIIRTSEGFYWCDSNGKLYTYDPLVMNDVVRSIVWRLKPNYVSFDEAYDALKQGKTISSYSKGVKYDTYQKGDYSGAIEIDEIFNYDWTIEE